MPYRLSLSLVSPHVAQLGTDILQTVLQTQEFVHFIIYELSYYLSFGFAFFTVIFFIFFSEITECLKSTLAPWEGGEAEILL